MRYKKISKRFVDGQQLNFYSMENTYSKTEFDGYTHRFMVQFEHGESAPTTLHIYSNCGDRIKLYEFIKESKSEKVISYEVVHQATKDQDDAAAKLVNEFLKD